MYAYVCIDSIFLRNSHIWAKKISKSLSLSLYVCMYKHTHTHTHAQTHTHAPHTRSRTHTHKQCPSSFQHLILSLHHGTLTIFRIHAMHQISQDLVHAFDCDTGALLTRGCTTKAYISMQVIGLLGLWQHAHGLCAIDVMAHVLEQKKMCFRHFRHYLQKWSEKWCIIIAFIRLGWKCQHEFRDYILQDGVFLQMTGWHESLVCTGSHALAGWMQSRIDDCFFGFYAKEWKFDYRICPEWRPALHPPWALMSPWVRRTQLLAEASTANTQLRPKRRWPWPKPGQAGTVLREPEHGLHLTRASPRARNAKWSSMGQQRGKVDLCIPALSGYVFQSSFTYRRIYSDSIVWLSEHGRSDACMDCGKAVHLHVWTLRLLALDARIATWHRKVHV